MISIKYADQMNGEENYGDCKVICKPDAMIRGSPEIDIVCRNVSNEMLYFI